MNTGLLYFLLYSLDPCYDKLKSPHSLLMVTIIYKIRVQKIILMV